MQDISFTILEASTDHLAEITHIYGHHVRTGLASFEEVAPDEVEMGKRYQNLRQSGYPYLVALIEERICGYAYAGPYRARPAYRHTVENSVYVEESALGKGVGGALLDRLIEDCIKAGFRQMIAVIGDRENHPSINLHKSRDFKHIGTFEAVGFKHGRWVDSVLMQRALGPGNSSLPD